MANLIALDKWCEDTGIPSTTFKNWKRKLTKGRHYYVVGRTTIVDQEELTAWLKAYDGDEQRGSARSQYMGSVTTRAFATPTLTLAYEKRSPPGRNG